MQGRLHVKRFDDSTVLVTGAGQGIGCAAALRFAREGATVIVAEIRERFGRLDVAVHNVGGTIWDKPFWGYTPDEIEAEIQRSLWPTLWCCHAGLPMITAAGAASIVNVGSVATRGINRVPYAAAKGGVAAITTSMALELADRGIRVNCITPGGVDGGPRITPRNTNIPSEAENGWMQDVFSQTLHDTLMRRRSVLWPRQTRPTSPVQLFTQPGGGIG